MNRATSRQDLLSDNFVILRKAKDLLLSVRSPRFVLRTYVSHPKNRAITPYVSMNPWARMHTHKLRPESR